MTTAFHLPLLLTLLGASGIEPARVEPGSQLTIEGDLLCPAEEAVRQALALLRPPAEWPADRVVIRSDVQRLSLDLGRASDKQRDLTMEPDCQARATAAALVIATWMDDLPAVVTGAPVLAPIKEQPLPPGPARHELGAGLYSNTGDGFQPGLYADFVRLRSRNDWGLLACLALDAPRKELVDGGVTRWLRSSAALGVQARSNRKGHILAVDLALAGAFVPAWGSGYASNKSDGSFTWGPLADLRAGFPWGRARLWVALRANIWVRPQSLQIDAKTSTGSARHDLPWWDAQVALGMSYLLP
jgi:hypothetical protein